MNPKKKRMLILYAVIGTVIVCLTVCLVIYSNAIISVPVQGTFTLFPEQGAARSGELDLCVEMHPFKPFGYTGTISMDGTTYVSWDQQWNQRSSAWRLLGDKLAGRENVLLYDAFADGQIRALWLTIYYDTETKVFYYQVIYVGMGADEQIYWGSSDSALTRQDILHTIEEKDTVLLMNAETLKQCRD